MRIERRIALSSGYSGAAALLFYAADRARLRLFGHEPNPATVIWSRHSGLFWRELGALFVAGFVFQATWLLARDRSLLLERALPAALFTAAALMAAQALLLP